MIFTITTEGVDETLRTTNQVLAKIGLNARRWMHKDKPTIVRLSNVNSGELLFCAGFNEAIQNIATCSDTVWGNAEALKLYESGRELGDTFRKAGAS